MRIVAVSAVSNVMPTARDLLICPHASSNNPGATSLVELKRAARHLQACVMRRSGAGRFGVGVGDGVGPDSATHAGADIVWGAWMWGCLVMPKCECQCCELSSYRIQSKLCRLLHCRWWGFAPLLCVTASFLTASDP